MPESSDHRAFDVVIAGAGPAGAAFALFLHARGVAPDRIALVDARSRDGAYADDRLIAIAHGTATLLRSLGAWEAEMPPATSIHTIHVSHRGRFGRTVISRDDHDVPALGYVVRHGDLTAALDAALDRAGFDVTRPLRVESVAPTSDDPDAELVVTLSDGSRLHARDVVHAEGGLFGAQEKRAIHRDYGQTAVTAFVTTASPADSVIAATAFERFTEHGPIALLPARDPATGRNGYALVWCGTPEDAAHRMTLADAGFLATLHAAFGDRLGAFATVGARRAFPLGLNAADQPAQARTRRSAEFAIGNAAQTLHPVAGQGMNLALRDAHELAELLVAAELANGGAGGERDAAILATRYLARRRRDRALTVGLTDLMPRVFASPLAPVALARGAALALLDVVAPLRGVIARQMMNGRR
jgi:2-octaprenyl-6-methoxyphenol hydroxylase